ncbi:DUF1876 family protein [Actinospica durhamensis]|uniref:DUF1876 family protein n=1 Tax=Actinospica durhamensis TaxID=1508375 RepID=A0A941EW44_9ACTN|nr:dsRBD fold-containing protein [Actinospica durhamensis]MBR7838900.1 DUF1876 family protein [Actinospica durhamensis]
MRVERRHVTLELTTEDGRTTAKAVLVTDERTRHGAGDAWRKATDFDVPEIGDELAAGRALVDLGTRLIQDAADDVGTLEGRRVTVGGVASHTG